MATPLVVVHIDAFASLYHKWPDLFVLHCIGIGMQVIGDIPATGISGKCIYRFVHLLHSLEVIKGIRLDRPAWAITVPPAYGVYCLVRIYPVDTPLQQYPSAQQFAGL